MVGMLRIIILNFAFIFLANAFCNNKPLATELVYKLSGARTEFPCDSTKNIYLSTGRFVPRNVIATRVQFYKDFAFVALPRLKQGVPMTLAYIDLKQKDCRASLKPYPCWSIQEEGNSEALQSVVDIFLDNGETLWALDSGIVNTLECPVRRSNPKLVGINVRTCEVVKIIDLSPFVTSCSQLQYVVVDFDQNGKPFAYISDAANGAIIVYNIAEDKGYRVILPKAATDCYEKDILYMSLIQRPEGNRIYFSYLKSPRMFYIKTTNLQAGYASGAVVDVGRKAHGSDMVLLGSDGGKLLFFRNKGEGDIYVWNTNSCFKDDNFLLVQKAEHCRLATHVVPGYRKLMWLIESNFNDFIANTDGCLGPTVVIHPLVKECD